jgi:hypothetical protein
MMHVRLCSSVVLAGLSIASVSAQSGRLGHVATLFAADGASEDTFGESVALGPDYVVIGAKEGGAGFESGSAYVYRLAGAQWTLESELVPSDGDHYDDFATAVDADGERLVVGAWRHDTQGLPQAGQVYLFARCRSAWTEVARLAHPDPMIDDLLGRAVAIDGTTLAASAPGAVGCFPGAGQVLVFVADESGTPEDPCDDTWNLQTTLVSSACSSIDTFGDDLDLDGERLVVGQKSVDDFRGAAFVFERSGDSWTEVQRIVAPDREAGDLFGQHVALDGDLLVVGAHLDVENGATSGSAYVFRRQGASFLLEAKLANPTTHVDEPETFGWSVDVENEWIVVGNPSDVQGAWAPGSVHAFRYENGQWKHAQVLKTLHISEDRGLGGSLALEGGRLVAGVAGDSPWGLNCGSAYLHSIQQGTWSLYGYGDGTSGPCPCGNDARSSSDGGCLSAQGQGARLASTGTDSATSDDFRLAATGLPPGKAAQLFSGPAPSSAFAFGNGLLFVGPPYKRHGLLLSDQVGNAVWGPGLAAANGWSAGTTRAFQVWFRDPGGPCGASVNASNGAQVTMQP